MRLRPHDKIFHADRLRKLRIQSLQKIFARCSRIKIVYFFEDAEDLRSHGRDFGHAEVEDIGLEHGHLILSGLRGLGVFNRQTALGHDVTVRNLSGPEDLDLRGRIQSCQNGKQEQRRHKYQKSDAVVMLLQGESGRPGKLVNAKG